MLNFNSLSVSLASWLKPFTKSVISIALITTLLTACGFKMRGEYLLPQELQTLYVTSDDTHGELTRLVKQHFKINKVKVIPAPRAEAPSLKILKDNLNRRTLSVFPNGQVAEYELIYTVKYQLLVPQQAPRSYTLNSTEIIKTIQIEHSQKAVN